MAIAERASFGGAAAGVVLGVEVQDNHSFAEPVLQPDRLAGLRRQGEVGSLVTDLNAACHARPASLCSPESCSPESRARSVSVANLPLNARAVAAPEPT